jgi:hypothetical protein
MFLLFVILAAITVAIIAAIVFVEIARWKRLDSATPEQRKRPNQERADMQNW